MQIHPFRIDIDLSRFVFVGREFFWPVEKFFHRSSIFYGSSFFSTCKQSLFLRYICKSKRGSARRVFFFGPVEKFFCWSRILWPVKSAFSGREVFWSVDREKSEKLDEKFLRAAGFSCQNVVCVIVRRIAFVSFGMKWENELF